MFLREDKGLPTLEQKKQLRINRKTSQPDQVTAGGEDTGEPELGVLGTRASFAKDSHPQSLNSWDNMCCHGDHKGQ